MNLIWMMAIYYKLSYIINLYHYDKYKITSLAKVEIYNQYLCIIYYIHRNEMAMLHLVTYFVASNTKSPCLMFWTVLYYIYLCYTEIYCLFCCHVKGSWIFIKKMLNFHAKEKERIGILKSQWCRRNGLALQPKSPTYKTNAR